MNSARTERVEQHSHTTWPMTSQTTAMDTFGDLHRITSPTLLLHGSEDPICSLSQSKVAVNVLLEKQVPTGLVVYPSEGHGFDIPENQRDRNRRILDWFLNYLPAAPVRM